jgi:hypothetical protein
MRTIADGSHPESTTAFVAEITMLGVFSLQAMHQRGRLAYDEASVSVCGLKRIPPSHLGNNAMVQ